MASSDLTSEPVLEPGTRLLEPGYPKDVLRAHGSNKKNFRFGLWAGYKPGLEHSDSRFKYIRLESRIDSFCKKNRPFDSQSPGFV